MIEQTRTRVEEGGRRDDLSVDSLIHLKGRVSEIYEFCNDSEFNCYY